jgi:hypothetical protein
VGAPTLIFISGWDQLVGKGLFQDGLAEAIGGLDSLSSYLIILRIVPLFVLLISFITTSGRSKLSLSYPTFPKLEILFSYHRFDYPCDLSQIYALSRKYRIRMEYSSFFSYQIFKDHSSIVEIRKIT